MEFEFNMMQQRRRSMWGSGPCSVVGLPNQRVLVEKRAMMSFILYICEGLPLLIVYNRCRESCIKDFKGRIASCTKSSCLSLTRLPLAKTVPRAFDSCARVESAQSDFTADPVTGSGVSCRAWILHVWSTHNITISIHKVVIKKGFIQKGVVNRVTL